LTLLTKGTFEIILYLISGILLYLIINKQKNNKVKDYKKIICGLIIGYLVANIILISNKYEIEYEKFKNNSIDENKNAIILLFDVDPSTYEPSVVIKNFMDTNPFFDFYKLPFSLYRNKILSEKFNENMNTYYMLLLPLLMVFENKN